jgi:primase-polymerase (primpol)-like protein
MKIKRVCRNCQTPLLAIARIDAAYCSTKCRVYSHRNPFPKEMIELRRWIRYSYKKIPLTPDNGIASSTHSRTWSDFPWVQSSKAGVGIGFVFNGDGIIGIDIDRAFDEHGNIKDWAMRIVNSLPQTYTEVSPSGKGLHIIGRGIVYGGRRWVLPDGGVEIYGNGRYFTMTGKRFLTTPKKLVELGTVLDKIEPIVLSL